MSTLAEPQQNIAQLRAKYALDKISSVKKREDSLQKQIHAYVHSLPAMIQMNGFGQAIAFYKAKGQAANVGQAYQLIYQWLSEWLINQQIYDQELMEAVCSNSMQDYQLAAAETQAILVWLKKFTQAYLKDESEEVSV